MIDHSDTSKFGYDGSCGVLGTPVLIHTQVTLDEQLSIPNLPQKEREMHGLKPRPDPSLGPKTY